MKHKERLHYLQAFILEVLRYASVGVLSGRRSIEDTYIKDYYIPKGTLVIQALRQPLSACYKT